MSRRAAPARRSPAKNAATRRARRPRPRPRGCRACEGAIPGVQETGPPQCRVLSTTTTGSYREDTGGYKGGRVDVVDRVREFPPSSARRPPPARVLLPHQRRRSWTKATTSDATFESAGSSLGFRLLTASRAARFFINEVAPHQHPAPISTRKRIRKTRPADGLLLAV